MNILQILGISAGIISTIGGIPYIIDIFKRKTKPERATWFIWSILGGIAFFSQLAKGATNSLWITGFESVGQVIIFILSLRYGYGKFKKKDGITLFIALIGLIIWFVTKEAVYALYIIMTIDFIGSILTIQKSYQDPESETLSTWVLSTIAGFLSILSVGKLNIFLLSYPVFIFVINGTIALAVIFGRKNQKKIKK